MASVWLIHAINGTSCFVRKIYTCTTVCLLELACLNDEDWRTFDTVYLSTLFWAVWRESLRECACVCVCMYVSFYECVPVEEWVRACAWVLKSACLCLLNNLIVGVCVHGWWRMHFVLVEEWMCIHVHRCRRLHVRVLKSGKQGIESVCSRFRKLLTLTSVWYFICFDFIFAPIPPVHVSVALLLPRSLPLAVWCTPPLAQLLINPTSCHIRILRNLSTPYPGQPIFTVLFIL